MNHLHRELAPVSESAWEQIDGEAREALREFLAARRLVDFSGPHGWKHAAITTGAVEPLDVGDDAVEVALRSVLRMVEVRLPFHIDRATLREVDRGAPSVDLDQLVDAARRAAALEDGAVFDGLVGAGIAGCRSDSDHEPVTVSSADDLPAAVTEASAVLQDAGVEGPFGLALGPDLWGIAMATSDDGYPLLKHLRLIVEGPVVRARTLSGGVLLSQRGGDFELIVGQDFAIGYTAADEDGVELDLTETFTFRNLEPAAAVGITAA
jgi:uncharacterized linocin/CFP29 family protein